MFMFPHCGKYCIYPAPILYVQYIVRLRGKNPGPLAGEWLQYETASGRSLATCRFDLAGLG